jgi:1,3-beta-glucanosyltransferase GAS1
MMSPVWSGAIAFSYFSATSPQGEFGMVTISADGSSVTPSADYVTLQQQYSNVAFINSPTQSAAGAATYPTCPATTASFNASDTLPSTPNDAACSCLEKNLSCQFTPQTNNVTAIVGVLLNQACSFLGQAGKSCSDISSDGTTGIYGSVSGCDPSTPFLVCYHFGFQRFYRHRTVICHESILRDY